VAYGYQATKSSTAAVAAVAANVPGTVGYDATKASTLGSAAVAAKTGVKASGFGVDTAAFTMAASEDLGGGLKLAGSMSLGGVTRGDTPTGEDFKMVLSGGFGSLLLGQIEIGSGIRGLAQAGAPVNNMEGEILAAASAGTDIVKYTAPKFGDFTVSGSLTEAKGLATGLSTGQSSAVTVGVDYAAGPVAAKFDFTDYDNDSTAINNRYRIAGNYDLGVAKVGAGHEAGKLVGAAKTKYSYTMFGVSAPVGASTSVGAVIVKSKSGTLKRSGYSVGAQYNLSKRTNVTANTAKWDNTVKTAKDSKTTILLNHSF
jgi:predicted porin